MAHNKTKKFIVFYIIFYFNHPLLFDDTLDMNHCPMKSIRKIKIVKIEKRNIHLAKWKYIVNEINVYNVIY